MTLVIVNLILLSVLSSPAIAPFMLRVLYFISEPSEVCLWKKPECVLYALHKTAPAATGVQAPVQQKRRTEAREPSQEPLQEHLAM